MTTPLREPALRHQIPDQGRCGAYNPAMFADARNPSLHLLSA